MEKGKLITWENYFVIICAFLAFAIFDIIKSVRFELTECIGLVLEVIALVALYGYYSKTPIFSPIVWRIYAIFYTIYLITYLVYGNGYQEIILAASQDHPNASMFSLYVSYNLAMITYLPLFISIFLYSKPTNSFWVQSPNKTVKQTVNLPR